MGAKRRLNGTSKVNTQMDRQKDRRTFQLIETYRKVPQKFRKKLANVKVPKSSKIPWGGPTGPYLENAQIKAAFFFVWSVPY